MSGETKYKSEFEFMVFSSVYFLFYSSRYPWLLVLRVPYLIKMELNVSQLWLVKAIPLVKAYKSFSILNNLWVFLVLICFVSGFKSLFFTFVFVCSLSSPGKSLCSSASHLRASVFALPCFFLLLDFAEGKWPRLGVFSYAILPSHGKLAWTQTLRLFRNSVCVSRHEFKFNYWVNTLIEEFCISNILHTGPSRKDGFD